MSVWTYVKGVVFVDLLRIGEKQHVLDYAIEEVLDSLPKVTGSEGSMTAQAVKLPGYNVSWDWEDKAQTRYAIVLNGDLRDRVFEQTFEELVRFMCRLAKRALVVSVNVSLCGDFGKRWDITDRRAYAGMWDENEWLNREVFGND